MIKKPTLIDNIFVNLFNKKLKSGNLIKKISDHLPNLIIIKNINKKTSKQNIKVRDLNSFDQDKYLEDLKELEDLHLEKHNNVNQMFNIYHDIINKHAPYKTLSKKETKLKFKPWITKSILQSIKKKNVLYRKFIKIKDKFWYNRYKCYRDTINLLITKSKRSYQENNTANKDVWTKINESIHNRTRRMEDIVISENGTILTNQETISNKFNQSFINTAKTLMDNIGKSNNKFQDFLKNPNEHSFFINESSPEEIMGFIKKIC